MVATGPKQEIPKATGWQIPGALTKHVVLDPGIAYTTADVLLFAGTNPVGFGAMLTATGVAATLKTAAVLQPSFLDKHPRFKKLVFDDRTPLRAGGLALLVVAGATVASGMWLPAGASLLFAIANFKLAESISKNKEAVDPNKPKEEPKKGFERFKQVVSTMFKRPELYLNAGFALAGLMAGGMALYMLPLVAVAFAIGVRNAIKDRPEYENHPKLITATAAGIFTGIGHQSGHGLIAAAHALNTVVLAEMERRTTPGGAKQIIKDIIAAPMRLFSLKSPFRSKDEQPAVADPSVQPSRAELPSSANGGSIPAPEVKPSELGKVDLQQAFTPKAKIQVAANENTPQPEAAQPERGTRPKAPDAP